MTTETSAAARVIRVLLLAERVEEFRRVREILHDEGDFHVHGARDADHAASLLTGGEYDTVLVDSGVWEDDGSSLIGLVRRHQPDAAIVVITEDENIDTSQPHGIHEAVRRETLGDGAHLARRITAAVDKIHSKRRETMLRWLEQDARTDRLTGLYNRHAFDEELAQRCQQSDEENQPVTLVLASLNGRDVVEETYGRQTSDELVRRAAGCVTWCIRGDDYAARIDRDTMAILLNGADINIAQVVARRIVHRMYQENSANELRSAPIEAVFGIASGVGPTPTDLVSAAMTQVNAQRDVRERPVPFLYMDEEDGPSVA